MLLNGFNVILLALCVTSSKGGWMNDGYEGSYRKVQPSRGVGGPEEKKMMGWARSTPAVAAVQEGDAFVRELAPKKDSGALTQFLDRFQPALDRETRRQDRGEYTHGISELKETSKCKSDRLPSIAHRLVRGGSDQAKQNQSLTICSRGSDKIICQRGNLTCLIHTKDQSFDQDQLSKAVIALCEKLHNGQDSFNISMWPNTRSKSVLPSSFQLSGGSSVDSEPSVTVVECSPLDVLGKGVNRALQEVIYSCMRKSDSQGKEVMSQARKIRPPYKVRDFTDVHIVTHPWCPRSTPVTCRSVALPKCTPCCNQPVTCLGAPPKCPGDEGTTECPTTPKNTCCPTNACPCSSITPPCCPGDSLTTCCLPTKSSHRSPLLNPRKTTKNM